MRYTLPDLLPGKSYYLQVRAGNDTQTSQWSPRFTLAVTKDLTPPDPVVGLTNVVAGDTFIMSWTPLDVTQTQNSDLDHYDLSITANSIEYIIKINKSMPNYTLTFATNKSLWTTAQATVVAKVRSVDTSGNFSTWSSNASATNPAPADITGGVATALYDSVQLTWTANTDDDLAFYRVRASVGGGTYTTVYEGTGTSFTHPSIAYTSDHNYKMYAVDKFGTASLSTVTVGPVRPKSSVSIDATPPGAPTAVTVSSGFDATNQQSYIDVSWTAPVDTDLRDYIIRYATTAGSWATMFVPSANTSVRIPVNAGRPYYIQVAARDFSGNVGTYANAGTYPINSTADTTGPAQPTAPTVSGNTLQLQVTQDNNKQAGGAMDADTDYYIVYASTTNGFTPGAANILGTIKAGTVTSAVFDVPASASSGSTQAWYVVTRPVDKSGNLGTLSNQTTSSASLIANANIADATINSAKIVSLTAEKLTAGSGVIVDLQIGNASSSGSISSYEYQSTSGASGWYMGKNSLIIKSGNIEAAALKIQSGSNIIQPLYADFEARVSSILVNTIMSGVTLDIDYSNSKYGTQSLKVITLTGFNVWGLGNLYGDYMTVEPNTPYICSFWAMVPVGANPTAVTPYLQCNTSGGAVNGTGAAVQNMVADGVWKRYYTTITSPSNASGAALLLFSNGQATTIFTDAWQVEPKTANLDIPSPWRAPGSTIIDGSQIRSGEIRSNSNVTINGVTQPTWSINVNGGAQFGDAYIRGNTTVGMDTTDGSLSYIRSYNYVAGSKGWKIDSNGLAEFRDVVAGSFDGAALKIGTVRAETVSSGTMNANISMAGNFVSQETDTVSVINRSMVLAPNEVTITTAADHGRVIGDRVFVALDIAAGNIATPTGTLDIITGIPASNKFVYVRSSGSAVSASGTDISGSATFYGRKSVMNPDGIHLYERDNVSLIIDFPTSPTGIPYFKGLIQTNGLNSSNNMSIGGPTNNVIPNAVMTLNGTQVPFAPIITGEASDNYIQNPTINVGPPPNGSFQVAGALVIGGSPRILFDDGNLYAGTTGTVIGLPVESLTTGGRPNLYAIFYGITYIGSTYYALYYRPFNSTWYVQGYNTSGTPTGASWVLSDYADFGATQAEFRPVEYGGILRRPAMGTDGTNILIARAGKTGNVKVNTYNTTGTKQGSTLNTALPNSTGDLRSVSKGTFDLGGTRLIITNNLKNNVMDSSGVLVTNESFYLGINPWFVSWDSTNSKFVGFGIAYLSNDNVNWSVDWSDYTSLYKATNVSTLNFKTSNINIDGRSFTVSNKAASGGTATLTITGTHDLVVGDVITVAGVDATFNGTYTITAVPSTSSVQYVKAGTVSSTAATGTIARTAYETPLSAVQSGANLVRRGVIRINSNLVVPPLNKNDPTGVRLYYSTTSGGTYYRVPNTATTGDLIITVEPVASGTSSLDIPFPAATPGKIVSSLGYMELSGYGSARFGVALTGFSLSGTGTSVTTLSDTSPPSLKIGLPASNNSSSLVLDTNGIQAYATNTTSQGLSLNPGGGTVFTGANLNVGGRLAFAAGGVSTGSINNNIATTTTSAAGQITVTHGLAGTPSGVTVNPFGGGGRAIVVSAVNGTTFTITVYNIATGATVNSTSVGYSWIAMS